MRLFAAFLTALTALVAAPVACAGQSGTGSYVSLDGAILTAAHVVQPCGIVTVVDPNDVTYQAAVTYKNRETDLAVVAGRRPRTVGGDALVVATEEGARYVDVVAMLHGVSDPATVEPGDHVLAGGFDAESVNTESRYTLRPGRVLDEPVYKRGDISFALSSYIERGNSGAAVVDSHGALVGMVWATDAEREGYGAAIGLPTILEDLYAADVEVRERQITDRASGPFETDKEIAMLTAAEWVRAATVRVICKPEKQP